METAPSVEARAEASGAGFEAVPSVEFTARVGYVAESAGMEAAVDSVEAAVAVDGVEAAAAVDGVEAVPGVKIVAGVEAADEDCVEPTSGNVETKGDIIVAPTTEKIIEEPVANNDLNRKDKVECASCHQFINPYYLKRHEKMAKCSKQRDKEATKTIMDGNEIETQNKNNDVSEPKKIPCKFCRHEFSPKSIRKREFSPKCPRLRKEEPVKRKRNHENEDSAL